jgi:mitochondrial chaperone BCS1
MKGAMAMLTTIWNFLSSQMASNQFMVGGFVLGALGLVVAYFRSLPGIFAQWLKNRIVTELNIPDKDESFQWLDYWLSKQKYQKRCRLLTVSTSKNSSREAPTQGPLTSGSPNNTREINLSPAPGFHHFWYKGRLIFLTRERKDMQMGGSGNGAGYRETFYLRCFTRKRQIIVDLLEEAKRTLHPPEDERVSVFVPSYGAWIRSAKKIPRPLDSVILPDNHAQDLLKHVTTFQASKDWYAKLGIPYRLGVLLYGPPGNGKSSVVMAIASELKMDVCVLSLSTSGMSDEKIVELFTDFPERAILLIEDIDCIYNQREKKEGADSITFSGLLNALDGVLAGDNRLLFMTTNHKEKLDGALIRPGRCDVHLFVDNATPDQASALFLRFFPDKDYLATLFGAIIMDVPVSMAEIQGHLLEYRNSAENCLTNWKNVVQLKRRDLCTTS